MRWVQIHLCVFVLAQSFALQVNAMSFCKRSLEVLSHHPKKGLLGIAAIASVGLLIVRPTLSSSDLSLENDSRSHSRTSAARSSLVNDLGPETPSQEAISGTAFSGHVEGSNMNISKVEAVDVTLHPFGYEVLTPEGLYAAEDERQSYIRANNGARATGRLREWLDLLSEIDTFRNPNGATYGSGLLPEQNYASTETSVTKLTALMEGSILEPENKSYIASNTRSAFRLGVEGVISRLPTPDMLDPARRERFEEFDHVARPLMDAYIEYLKSDRATARRFARALDEILVLQYRETGTISFPSSWTKRVGQATHVSSYFDSGFQVD